MKTLEQKFKAHLLNTVGKEPSKEEMELVYKKLQTLHDIISDRPDVPESLVTKVYNKELSAVWDKVEANELTVSELKLFQIHTKVKPNYHIASFASGLGIYELFLAKEFVPQGVVTCIDISERMNNKAKEYAKKLNQNNVKILTASVTSTPVEEGSQDIILIRRSGLSWDKKWIEVLRESYRVMKKNENSTLIYTVDKKFIASTKKIKSDLEKAQLRLITTTEWQCSNTLTICMVVARVISPQNK